MSASPLPDARSLLSQMRAARAAADLLLVGLDFDGTLAPIVPRPEDATLPERTRAALAHLSRRADTTVALVSGRSIADLRQRVLLDDVYYAGNHGMEVDGPGDVRFVHDEAAALRTPLATLTAQLREELAGIDGVIIEDKGLTMSVHFRTVREPQVAEHVRTHTHTLGRDYAQLRMTDGKMVVEVRPAVDWHKGRAFALLREHLLRDRGARALFIGDDRTDEDVFSMLMPQDWPIVVGVPQHVTVARAQLPSTDDVATFIEELAA